MAAIDNHDDIVLPLPPKSLYLLDYDPLDAPRPWIERKWKLHVGQPGIIVSTSTDPDSGVMQFPGNIYRDFRYATSQPPPIRPFV